MPFSEKQREFLDNANHRWNIKSGATRSGKTYIDLYVIPKRIRSVSGKDGLNVLLGNTKSTLQRNIIEPLQELWGVKNISDIRSDNTATIMGEKVYCLGADKISQVDKLRGSSIKYCYGDEIVTWHKEVFEMLKSRLDKPYSRFDGTCNPEGPTHWFKSFLDNEKNADIYLQEYTIDDNPFLPEEFVKNLKIEYANTVYYDRYILGKWVRAEGIIFKELANNPLEFTVKASDVPKAFRWCEVGFDIGGNGSAYALTCCAEGLDGIYYVLKSKKTQANEVNMQDIERLVCNFCDYTHSKYKSVIGPINSDHIAAITNTITSNTLYAAYFTYKPPLEDRVFAISKLLAQKKIKFVEGECDDLIDEMSNLVYDEKSGRTIPLDDGTMQIDTWDSFIYSLSGNWQYLDT